MRLASCASSRRNFRATGCSCSSARARRFARGTPSEADAALTQGLSQFERDTRPKIPGERAFWLYKRGMARVLLKRAPDAEADLRAALENQPVEWVRGRIHLELGKVADLQGKRAVALGEYRQARTIADANDDALAEAAASRFERRPYGG